MSYQGDYLEDATVLVPFTTNDAVGGAVAPSDAFEAADLKIYKDGSDVQKVTTNGVTMVSPFDSITGLHHVTIDTSIDTGDIGFWAVGSDYSVVLEPDETVDTQTVVAVLAEFSIENRNMRGTDIGGLNNFDPANDDVAVVTDVTNDVGVTQAGADKVWASAARTLTSFGTLIADIWAYATRTLTDKTGFFISGVKTTLDDLNDLSAAEITALFAGQLVPGVLQNGITVAPGATIGITRGDDKTLTFNLGTQWDLTGKLVYFIIKKDPTADNNTAIVNRLVDTIVDAANGIAQIDLDGDADETTPVDCYWYEVEVRDDPGDNNPQTPLRGRLSILQDVRQ